MYIKNKNNDALIFLDGKNRKNKTKHIYFSYRNENMYRTSRRNNYYKLKYSKNVTKHELIKRYFSTFNC